MNDPVWSLPPFVVHQSLLAEQVSGQLPWFISDYSIEKYVWPKDSGAIKVGVVDTGASLNHPELDGKIEDAKDFTGNPGGASDGNSHGSSVAGIISAKNFGIHKAGKLVIAKGLSDSGIGSDATLSNAIKFCGDAGCKIINISAGSTIRSPMISGILKELYQQGCITVVAAGNESSEVGWPAREDFVIAVTALTRQRVIADYSNRGSAADCAAPGSEIRSLGRGSTFTIMSGTSFSSPWIAGYIAAYASHQVSTGKKFPSFQEIMDWIGRTATDLGEPGKDWLYGLGVPNAAAGFDDIQPAPTPGQPAVTPSGFPASILVTMPSGKQAIYKNPTTL